MCHLDDPSDDLQQNLYQRWCHLEGVQMRTPIRCLAVFVALMCLNGCTGMAWKRTTDMGSIAAYEAFLREYPESEFIPEARRKLEALRFDEAKMTGTVAAYEDFLRRYPQATFAQDAQQKLEDLRLHEARMTGTVAAYEGFLRHYPQSRFVQTVRRKIEALYFHDAEATGTIAAYETFLKRYPQSELAEEAHQKLETLRLDAVKATGTIAAYEDFLTQYPASPLAGEAVRNLQALKQEIHDLEEATKKVLPEGATVEVTTISRYPQEPEFVIAAHLLEGHAEDESSPYVRGDYGTHEKLTRLVQFRCAKILKSIAKNAALSNGPVLVIRGRHGVRQSSFPGGLGGSDTAMTIYEVGVPVSTLREKNVQSMDDELVMRLWEVRSDIIPELHFQTE